MRKAIYVYGFRAKGTEVASPQFSRWEPGVAEEMGAGSWNLSFSRFNAVARRVAGLHELTDERLRDTLLKKDSPSSTKPLQCTFLIPFLLVLNA